MDDLTIARIVHVVAVLLWIGGVAFVTLVLIPAIRGAEPPERRLAAFHRIEDRFAAQARLWVALAGLSGLWMVWRGAMWDRFAEVGYWWMHAMVAVWLVFAAMLFVIEPLFLHRRMKGSTDPAGDFARMGRLHHLLLAVSLIAVIGAVGGAHGLF
ncbi:hypothetical protein [Paracoccus yeei]|jgi:uncharacterized membrane protein|uniref:Copper resistance protein D domain-containing protein n=1 Tax=Paracoccus yeei TaxID=147645 RepID=A0A2D2C2W6_9RHOB|nr:hypothetical protein [Paracoccus yeei]ATQ56841.1 hypothetical protein PYTT13_14255 [Paracoccus yeei]MBY0134854.1 hypothetical protein [Paracoccus yeei]QEU08453.1 hypothetical protein FOB51_10820 [Paracoccus yeei]